MSNTCLSVLLFLLLQLYNAEKLCDKFGNTHTMCLPDKHCNTASAVTEEQKKEFVDQHNKLRQKIAKGEISPQPRAANMKIMKWNEELAKVAQKWADNCEFKHDENRLTEEFEQGVGQNVFIASGKPPPQLAINTAVISWFNEHKDFDPDLVEKVKYTEKVTGHYTQVVWAQSTDVGCGYSKYKEGDGDTLLVVCNYGPAGNMVDGPMYKIGVACSACPDKCSVKFDGLCDPKDGKPKSIDINKAERNIRFRTFVPQMTLIFYSINYLIN